MIHRLFQQHARLFIGIAAGAVVGYAIYRFIGCRTGACPLTADPVTAIAVYAVLGGLLFRKP
jgi:hypothetical protein